MATNQEPGMRIRLIRALGLEETLLKMVRKLDAALRRWPWLYRQLGGNRGAED